MKSDNKYNCCEIQQSFRTLKHSTPPKYKGSSSKDHRERGSHARGASPTQDTSRMGTARVKQEEEKDEIWKKGMCERLGKIPTKA